MSQQAVLGSVLYRIKQLFSKKDMQPEILTLQEAAKLLRISYGTLRSLINRGKIPAFKEGRTYRIRSVDIEKRFKKQV